MSAAFSQRSVESSTQYQAGARNAAHFTLRGTVSAQRVRLKG